MSDAKQGGFKNTEDTRLHEEYVINNNFKYHAPIGNQQERYVSIRSKAKELALLINKLCPKSREKSLAMTQLEQSVMWANASIARNEN